MPTQAQASPEMLFRSLPVDEQYALLARYMGTTNKHTLAYAANTVRNDPYMASRVLSTIRDESPIGGTRGSDDGVSGTRGSSVPTQTQPPIPSQTQPSMQLPVPATQPSASPPPQLPPQVPQQGQPQAAPVGGVPDAGTDTSASDAQTYGITPERLTAAIVLGAGAGAGASLLSPKAPVSASAPDPALSGEYIPRNNAMMQSSVAPNDAINGEVVRPRPEDTTRTLPSGAEVLSPSTPTQTEQDISSQIDASSRAPGTSTAIQATPQQLSNDIAVIGNYRVTADGTVLNAATGEPVDRRIAGNILTTLMQYAQSGGTRADLLAQIDSGLSGQPPRIDMQRLGEFLTRLRGGAAIGRGVSNAARSLF